MSTRYQYENLLRKPVEYYSAAVYIVAALITVSMPQLLLMPKAVAFTGSWVLLFRGVQRFFQGYRLHEYQRTLSRLGSFQTTPKPLMKAKKAQWLGLGFVWEGRHTQRLFDLEKPENRHLLIEKKFSKMAQYLFNWLDHKLPHPYRQAHELPLPEGGGRPEIHAIGLWEGEKDIGIYFSNHIGHSLILGNIRTGKTRLMEVELIQAIARQETVLLFDTKGDGDLLKRAYTQSLTNKTSTFYYINFFDIKESHAIYWHPKRIDFKKTLGDTQETETFMLRYLFLLSELLHHKGLSFNHIENIYHTPHAFLAEMLQKHIESSTGQLIDTKNIQQLCIEYYQRPSIHQDLYNAIYHLLQIEPNLFGQTTRACDQWVLSFLHSDFAPLFFYNPSRKQIHLDTVMANSETVCYLGINLKKASQALGFYTQMMFEDITHIHTYQAGIKPPTILADELGNLLKHRCLDILNTLGQAGIKVSLYEQYLPKSNGQNAQSIEYILSHFSQLIFFRHAEQAVCDYLMRRQKDVHVTTTDLISGTVDNSNIHSNVTFTSSTTQRQTRQRTALLSINDFVALPVGQAFVLLNGNELIKLRIPLVDFIETEKIPASLTFTIDRMKKHYQSIHHAASGFAPGAYTTNIPYEPPGFTMSALMGSQDMTNYQGYEKNELMPPEYIEESEL